MNQETKSNLYKTLRVKKTASKDQLKTAFRKLSKKYHPDVKSTGDHDKFIEVETAYRVLSDDTRREMYDRTGRWEQEKIQNDFDKMVIALGEVYTQFLEAGVAFNNQIEIHAAITMGITKVISEHGDNIQKLAKQAAALNRIRDRIVRKDDGENLFQTITDNHIRNADEAREKAEETVRILRMVLEEMENYKSFDDVVHRMTWTRGSTTTTSGATGSW